MLRPIAKSVLASSLNRSAADSWIGRLSGARTLPLIIAYHRVVEDVRAAAHGSIPGMSVSCAMLERHLDWIARRFRFVSLDELGHRFETGGPFEEPLAALTFDDGYRDVYENAFPLLLRKGIPAALFVVTELVESGRPQLHDRLYLLLNRMLQTPAAADRLLSILESLSLPLSSRDARRAFSGGAYPALRFLLHRLSQSELRGLASAIGDVSGCDDSELAELRPITWEALERMRAAGFTVGSHGRTHALLTLECGERVRYETAGSRAELERHLGASVKHFAYPDGDFDAGAVQAVAAAGYGFAYTICPHRDPGHPLLTIPRRMLWEGACLDVSGRFSDAVMSCHVNGVFDLMRRCPRRHAHSAQ
jgi:peptidoglycan/xylan/chitin deacetylase (PgdA/CDA1 family)